MCVALAAPIVTLIAQGADITRGPAWVWVAVYAAFLAAFIAATVLSEHPSRALRASVFALQQALAIAAVTLLSGAGGFVSVILVFGAALSVYIVPRWATVLAITANTLAIWWTTLGSSPQEQGLSALFYLAIQILTVVTVATWRRQEEAQRDLQRAHAELAATSALLERSTRTEERLRISRDLHDVAGHQLTALALELEIAAHTADGDARTHVKQARDVAKDLLASVRDTVSQLRADDEPLDEILPRAVVGVSSPAVSLDIAPGLRLDEATTAALVRATQEIVTNAIRHAPSASTLAIRVAPEGDRVVLEGEDDGWAPAHVAPGNGLTGMRERAEELGGSAEFGRAPGGGFRARVEVPA